MSKAKPLYFCQSCGASSPKWAGKCPHCEAWGTLALESVAQRASPFTRGAPEGVPLPLIPLTSESEDAPRTATGMAELDRVLGGGMVEGSATLLGGDPGIGKSTLLLQIASALAAKGKRCVYISGEESEGQIQLRAKRMGIAHPDILLATGTSVEDVVASLNTTEPPDLLLIDSIQTMHTGAIDAAPGTVSQVRASAHALIHLAKTRGIALILVGHVTKDGQIAGPRVLEHMVDTVLYFEGERGMPFRILRAVKHRFGSTEEIGVFEMAEKGLAEVANPSTLFLSQSETPISGSAIFAGMEGSRPFLVDIQALVSPSFQATPRRAVVGWDSNRLAMILAVLETRCNVRFSDKEVYLTVAGGFRVSEPAADLAVAAALLSAVFDQPIPASTLWFGELGLSGEIRRVGRVAQRLKEAAKLGFTRAVIPEQGAEKQAGITTDPVAQIRNLVLQFRPKPERRAVVSG